MPSKVRKDTQITISLPVGYKEKLEEIARQYGCTWGDRPSVARLLRDIVDRDLLNSSLVAEESAESQRLRGLLAEVAAIVKQA